MSYRRRAKLKRRRILSFSVYTSQDRDTAFPLGGIGTGTISIDAAGRLCDFEIMNHPDKGCKLPYSFFAMHVESEGFADTRVLEARSPAAYDQACGYHPQDVHGLPHMARSSMSVAYPFCDIDFSQEGLPVHVGLTAMSPLVPLCVEDSGIPAILLRYRVRNVSDRPVRVLLCGSMPNFYGFQGFDVFGNCRAVPGLKNLPRTGEGFRGVLMTGEGEAPDSLRFAQGALMAAGGDVLVQPMWYKGGWQDGITSFWKALCQGRLGETATGSEARPSTIGPEGLSVASVGIRRELAPGKEADFPFVISWYVPNRLLGWFEWDNPGRTMRNAFAARFADAWEAGAYLMRELPRLEGVSRSFAQALYGSTLPESVIESLAYSITVLRSNTCFLGEDGAFYGWEGCHAREGSCHGTCTHVWNYAQTVAFLFPSLERSARRNELLVETAADGKMSFRTQQPFGLPPLDMPAAADGQLGTLVRLWREYLLSGDRDFLAEVYPTACDALDYARRTWDPDGDGLLEAMQHNTYDIEFVGVNPLSGVMYLAALHAMAAMARTLGRDEDAARFRAEAGRSAAALDKACFNGEWYEQRCPDNAPPYQFGSGCLSDQLLGQTLAFLTNLGPLLPEEHLRHAARSIFAHNFSDGSRPQVCLQRSFTEPDEAGLRLCSWPRGGEPAFPFVYSDEVWTGVEYQVATLLVCLGMTEEAVTMVDAIRRRHDGNRRNPFNEMECGFHYARSMAAWGLLPALSGMRLSPDGETTFQPRIHQEHFSALYCDGRSWGVFTQDMENGQPVQRCRQLGCVAGS